MLARISRITAQVACSTPVLMRGGDSRAARSGTSRESRPDVGRPDRAMRMTISSAGSNPDVAKKAPRQVLALPTRRPDTDEIEREERARALRRVRIGAISSTLTLS